jgi:hypothetical protein
VKEHEQNKKKDGKRGRIMNRDFIQVCGEHLEVNGERLMMRGLGVGSWMNIEHFMLGIPGTESVMREAFREVFGAETAEAFFDSFLANFLTEEDFVYLSSLGINTLRLPVNYHHFIDDQHPETFLEKGFQVLDPVLRLCERYKIYAILELHAVPGGQNPDWHSDNNTGISHFWHYRCFRDQIVRLWGHIARHYAKNPWVGAYDLLNEPFLLPEPSLLQEFYNEAVAEIRKFDRSHVIFLEGDRFAMDFSMLEMPEDPQVAFEFHYYPTVWNPDALSERMPAAERTHIFEDGFREMLALRERFHRPLWCGELGCVITGNDPGFICSLDREMLELCEKHAVSWTLWAYKDSQYMGIVHPGDETPWIRFSNKIRARWKLPEEMETADKTLHLLGEKFFDPLEDGLRYKLQFRLRTLFQTIYTEQILKPELRKLTAEELLRLPESFRLSNCTVRKEMDRMLRELVRQAGE